ncbi:MAG TPA: DUF933 domain-containing protein [Thiothrix sp.]|nr:DUF933 domain-containing protein [Thiothrix sp.]
MGERNTRMDCTSRCGKIHTGFEKGFILVEVMTYNF